MEHDIDTETSTDQDTTVHDPTAASSFGNPSLDSDKIDSSTEAAIDSLLDETIRESEQEYVEPTPRAAEPVAAPSPTEPTYSPTTEIDPEIASIEQPRNLSELNRNNWKKLQETASIYKRQAQEAEALKERLQSEATQPQLPPDYEDLRKFRQIFDLQNDSEFQAKYNKPIADAKETIYGLLRKHGASDDVISSIETAGGPDKVDQNWWKENAIDKLPLLDAETLKDGLKDIYKLKSAQEGEINHASENLQEFMVKRGEAQVHWYESEQEKIYNYVDTLTKEVPWARFMEPTANSTAQEIQEIQRHNDRVKDLSGKFESALYPTTSEERANVAAAAVFSHVLVAQLQSEQQARVKIEAEVKRLTDENSKIKGASRMPRSTVNASVGNKGSSLYDKLKMSSSDAIDLGLEEAGA